MRTYHRDSHTEITVCRELKRRVVAGYWRPGDRLPTEHELAREFKISRGTVCKALKTLEQDGLFRAQRGQGRFVCVPAPRQKTNTIGIVISDFDFLQKPNGAGMFRALREVSEVEGQNYKLIALNPLRSPFHFGLAKDCSEIIQPKDFDGLVLITQMIQLESAIELSGVCPVVWIHHPTIKPGLAGVRFDFMAGGYLAMRHLLELGHRQIGFINVPEVFVSSREQLDGMRLAMRECADAQLLPAYVDTFDKSSDEVQRAMQRLLEATPRPTAVICGSDDYAPGVWGALQAANLRVPQDISLLSWNDTLTPEEVPIPVTTIHLDNAEAGRLAGAGLQALLRQRDTLLPTRYVPATLIPRASTAQPAR